VTDQREGLPVPDRTVSALDGRVVAITGGNRGIGRVIAQAMSRAGAAVVVGTLDPASVDHVREDLDASVPGIDVLPCDVTDDMSMAQFAEAILQRHRRIDAVIANAGIAGPTALLHEIDPTRWRECIEVDLTGVFLTFRHFLPTMIEKRAGRLIAVSSVTAKRPLVGRAPYAAAKMGIIGLMRTLALEIGPYGICANTVSAGSVEGPRLDSVIAASAAARGVSMAEARREHEAPAALKRLVRAEEVAQVCVFLAGDASSAITGEDINVSAGAVMY
jgi:NAD(P)-dependent dehydrogenase (short-subunit alcohol dehydrogenase family)